MNRHPQVPHPRELRHKQPGLRHHSYLPPGLGIMAKATNRLAFVAAALYGGAATILVFLIYSVASGLAKGNLQLTLLTWSNGVQLVFCAVMTYVGNQLAKQGQAKDDADHLALTHIAEGIDKLLAAAGNGSAPHPTAETALVTGPETNGSGQVNPAATGTA
jgi:hypothetical protein